MKHRFFSPPPLAVGTTIALAEEELHHAVRAVRVREGEEVEVFDGRGASYAGVVVSISREAATIRIDGKVESMRESPLAIDLAMSIIQLEKFELVLQKATELGVGTI